MNCKHLLITRIFFLSIILYKDLIMKILIFAVIILTTNLFSINTYSQNINLDFNCDYLMDSSDEKWSNGTLNDCDGAITSLIGKDTNFHSGLIKVFTGSGNGDLYIFNCFFIKN